MGAGGSGHSPNGEWQVDRGGVVPTPEAIPCRLENLDRHPRWKICQLLQICNPVEVLKLQLHSFSKHPQAEGSATAQNMPRILHYSLL